MVARLANSIESQYYDWLYRKIGLSGDKNPARSYYLLAEQLFEKEFVAFVPNDDNRAFDGLDLRTQFVDEVGSWRGSRYIFEPCNMLEMLIALATRLEFECEGIEEYKNNGVGVWFWRMLENIELHTFTDEKYMDTPGIESYVDAVLEVVVQRRYSPNGEGGLFPLRHADEDQRDVELWYQAAAYLLENVDF